MFIVFASLPLPQNENRHLGRDGPHSSFLSWVAVTVETKFGGSDTMSQEKSTPQDIKGSPRNRTTSECSVASDDGAVSSTFASKRYGFFNYPFFFLI